MKYNILSRARETWHFGQQDGGTGGVPAAPDPTFSSS